jgi:hypothetical protein
MDKATSGGKVAIVDHIIIQAEHEWGGGDKGNAV